MSRFRSLINLAEIVIQCWIAIVVVGVAFVVFGAPIWVLLWWLIKSLLAG